MVPNEKRNTLAFTTYKERYNEKERGKREGVRKLACCSLIH